MAKKKDTGPIPRKAFVKGRKAPQGFYPAGITDRSGEYGYGISLFADSVKAFEGFKGPSKINANNHVADELWHKKDQPNAWSGGITRLDRWVEIARQGWPEGVTRMRESLKAVDAGKARSIRRKRVRGPEGDHLDIHRVYGGMLDTAWDRTEPRTNAGGRSATGSPVIRMWVEISAPGSIEPGQMFWRGAAALACCEALEEAGYRVEINAYAQSNKSIENKPGQLVFTQFMAKEAGAPLDVERVVFLTAHPASFRVAGFAYRLISHFQIREGMGCSVHRRPAYAEESDPACTGVFSKEGAQKWVDETMARYR